MHLLPRNSRAGWASLALLYKIMEKLPVHLCCEFQKFQTQGLLGLDSGK